MFKLSLARNRDFSFYLKSQGFLFFQIFLACRFPCGVPGRQQFFGWESITVQPGFDVVRQLGRKVVEGFKMKKVVLALAAVAALSGPALAADLPAAPAYTKAPPPRPVASWTGCYLEAGGGYGLWNQDQFTETFPGLAPTSAATTTDGGRGVLGRFGGGCDWQLTGELSNWVVGGLAEYDVMSLKGTNNFANVGVGNGFGAPSFASEKETSAWYVGPRVGYLVTPNLLTYVGGGYTQTHFGTQNFTFLNTGIAANAFLAGTTYSGWFVSTGLEYALNLSWLPIQGLFLRSDYRFASYNAKDILLQGPGATPGFAQHSTPNVQTATTSLVWKLNWGGPVMAKY
jgi:outer membrane immunogenic protein